MENELLHCKNGSKQYTYDCSEQLNGLLSIDRTLHIKNPNTFSSFNGYISLEDALKVCCNLALPNDLEVGAKLNPNNHPDPLSLSL